VKRRGEIELRTYLLVRRICEATFVVVDCGEEESGEEFGVDEGD
jgi:hypothetical protein